MRSLSVFTALALTGGWAALASAQDEELPPELAFDRAPEDDAPAGGPPQAPGPAEAADDAGPPGSNDPAPAPRGPLVPPGGVPEVGGPTPGEPERPEPEPPPPRPPIPPPVYSLELQIRASFPAESSFDRALTALRYRGARVIPTGYVGVQIPLVDWLWIGGRLGVRGMSWAHPEREGAAAVAGDLLATAQVRFALGRVIELGILFGGGAAWFNVQLDGVGSDQLAPRFLAEGIVAFRTGRHFAIGPRFGWDYFQWEGMNAYEHGLDIGGPFFGLSLEGRE